MIQFNELRITPDGKKLIIDVSVKDLEYYKDVYISEIIIDTQDTFINTGPSSNPIYRLKLDENTPDESLENYTALSIEFDKDFNYKGSNKNYRLELDKTDLLTNLQDNLFFVYVKTTGTPAMNTPCGMDHDTTLGVVSNLYPLYQHAFGYIKELGDTCTIPKNLINFILQFKAFQLAVKTGHYIEAIKYWKKFFMSVKDTVVTSNCGCHG